MLYAESIFQGSQGRFSLPIKARSLETPGSLEGARQTGLRAFVWSMTKNTPDSFWTKVDKRGPDECWPWMGYKQQQGYGQFWMAGKSIRAHRISYELSISPIPVEICVCHKCDNPPCCNPKHLFLGTQIDNTLDRHIKGRSVRGEYQGAAKLSSSQVLEINALIKDGLSFSVIAQQYGITRPNVSLIKNGRTWSWLTGRTKKKGGYHDR